MHRYAREAQNLLEDLHGVGDTAVSFEKVDKRLAINRESWKDILHHLRHYHILTEFSQKRRNMMPSTTKAKHEELKQRYNEVTETREDIGGA